MESAVLSIKLMSLVWDMDLPQGRKLVLLSLADQANDGGQCFPSFETLQRRCGMARRTLFDCLRDLEQAGLITRIPMGQPGRQRIVFQVNEESLRQIDLLPETGADSAPVRNLHRCEIRAGAENSTGPVRNLHSIKQPKESNQSLSGARAGALNEVDLRKAFIAGGFPPARVLLGDLRVKDAIAEAADLPPADVLDLARAIAAEAAGQSPPKSFGWMVGALRGRIADAKHSTTARGPHETDRRAPRESAVDAAARRARAILERASAG